MGGGDNGSGGSGGGGGGSGGGSTGSKGVVTAVPPMYTKLVTTKASHIETILKLVGTPEGPILVERFKIMWPDGTAGSTTHLLLIIYTFATPSHLFIIHIFEPHHDTHLRTSL